MDEKCEVCGVEVDEEMAGVSWAHSWRYSKSGDPELISPHFRCAECTKKHGPASGNCAGAGYSGVNKDDDI